MPECHICGKLFKSGGIARHRAACYDKAPYYVEADAQPGQPELCARRSSLERARRTADFLAMQGRSGTIYELHHGKTRHDYQAVEIERWEAPQRPRNTGGRRCKLTHSPLS